MRLTGIWTAALLWSLAGTPSANAQPKGIRILLFGDVNLGRNVGQELLHDSTANPFRNVADELGKADIVFANLESQICERHGETEDPKSNIVFCAPPVAADVLRRAHITIVSTANNHAFDYGMDGVRGTIKELERAGVAQNGLTAGTDSLGSVTILERGGVRVGFVAYATTMNRKVGWRGHIAAFDRVRVRKEIPELRKQVDYLIVSYHGGKEYADSVSSTTADDLRALVDAGADLVAGHHPHVALGVWSYKGKWIFPSLGNFVFIQHPKWAQRSYAADIELTAAGGKVTPTALRLRPVKVSGHPTFEFDARDRRELFDRAKRLSNVPLVEADGALGVNLAPLTTKE